MFTSHASGAHPAQYVINSWPRANSFSLVSQKLVCFSKWWPETGDQTISDLSAFRHVRDFFESPGTRGLPKSSGLLGRGGPQTPQQGPSCRGGNYAQILGWRPPSQRFGPRASICVCVCDVWKKGPSEQQKGNSKDVPARRRVQYNARALQSYSPLLAITASSENVPTRRRAQ